MTTKIYGWLRLAESGPGLYDPPFLRGESKPSGYTSAYLPLYAHPEEVPSETVQAKAAFNQGIDACMARLSEMHARTNGLHNYYGHACAELVLLKG